MKKITSIYIPALHRELAPAGLPEAVLFLTPGLEPAGPGSYQPANLPFSGPAARAVLGEMLELGSTLSLGGKDAPAGELRSIESGTRAAGLESAALGAAEKQELENFSGSGQSKPTKAGAKIDDGLRAELVRAQKILLLAWELEENLLDIKKAEAALAGQDRLLLAMLHGPEDTAGNPAVAETGPAPLAWPVFLEAAAPFLPAEALLITANPDLSATLAELAPLAELPEEIRAGLETDAAPLPAQARFALARLGDLVGGKDKAASRPWLGNTCNFVLLPR